MRCWRYPGKSHKTVSECPVLVIHAEHMGMEVGTWRERERHQGGARTATGPPEGISMRWVAGSGENIIRN